MPLADDIPMVESVLNAIEDTFRLTQGKKKFLARTDPTSKNSNNPTRRMDRIAQQNLKTHLEVTFGGSIYFVAEEPEPEDNAIPADLTEIPVDVAILDPIDGTDLWAKGFGNWCIPRQFLTHEMREFAPRLSVTARATFIGRLRMVHSAMIQRGSSIPCR